MSKKISLCMIVGNVEEYITRCLESFAPVADEIVLVRAIGDQEPDGTIELAEKVAESLGIPIRFGYYQNHPDHADWPHVDSFAAARQMSFDMAEGDYCLWVDSDDVLKSGAERIRLHAERGEFAAYIFPYEILGKGVTVPRERLVRKDAGRWQFPVHECFKFHVEPVVGAQDDGVVILHLPHLSKTGSNDRNLRILESIPESEMTPGLKYHMFQERLGDGQKDAAIALGVQMLTENELGKDERYDVLLTLVLQTNDTRQREDLLHTAYRVDPTRREALGVLSGTSIDEGRNVEALAYARQMFATPEPARPSWNSRTAFYGYTGDEIFQQALRANGLKDDAEKVRLLSLKKHGGARITLIHATRGRALQASRCRKRWFDLAEKPGQVEHVFVFDSDDKESHALRRFNHIEIQPGGGCVNAWNIGVFNSSGKVFVQLSDDWTPPPQWDKTILERLGNLDEPKVLAVSDGKRTDNLLCMAIMTRPYFEQDWFMFHPEFTGVYSDNWFTDEAYRRGQVVEARDVVFEHKHPAFGSAEVDATYAAQNSPEQYAKGLATYNRLKTGTDWSSAEGWFNYWWYYDFIVSKLKDGDEVVEVGSWLGRSVIYLAQACQRAGKQVKITSVDTFKGEVGQTEHVETVEKFGGSVRAAFEANLKRCGVSDMVNIIEGDSAASADLFADSSLAFCYIDAAHDYESVKKDITAWSRKIKPEGTLAGHDAVWHEVRKAVDELCPGAKYLGVVWQA